jgi:transcriptional regulator with XRE-family HTH domain
MITTLDRSHVSSVKKVMGLEELGPRLRERRKALGLSQRDVAEQVTLHQSEISDIEAGDRVPPRMDKLVELGQFYGLSPNDLAEMAGWWVGTNEPRNNPYWELAGEILSSLPSERQNALLQQFVNMLKTERLAQRSIKSRKQLTEQ